MTGFSEQYRKEINRLLKRLKQPQDAVKGFIDDIEFGLKIDSDSFAVRTSNKDQRKTLLKILKQTETLLLLISKYHFDEKFDIAPVDLQTVISIADSRNYLRSNLNKSLTPTPNDCCNYHFNYPTALIDSLQELKDAVFHAAEAIKLNKGNNLTRNPEVIRKRILARTFVESYRLHFNKYPPLTELAPANQVFNLLIAATKMSGENHLHYLRFAIDNIKSQK